MQVQQTYLSIDIFLTLVVLSLLSQMQCTHQGINEYKAIDSKSQIPPPGMWHVHHQPGITHHISLMPIWFGTVGQQRFWTDLGVWLELVEKGRHELSVQSLGGQ
jgi:hypothetical protein